MRSAIWISDREPSVRDLFGEMIPEAEVLAPAHLEERLLRGLRPEGLVIDGTQYLELPSRVRAAVRELPRVLVCTGLLLASMPLNLVSGPGIAVLGKPFSLADLEAATDWVRGAQARLPAAPPTPAMRRLTTPPPSARPPPGRASVPPS